MDDDNKLEQYCQLYSAMLTEGDGYYFYGYESESSYDFDPALQTKFAMARDYLEEFKEALEERIIQAGGNPEDYEV